MVKEYQTFKDFYPFYLSQHQNETSRHLHFIGTTLVILFVAHAMMMENYWLLLAALVSGYGFAWVGHFFFEKNRPATLEHPFYSLWGDFVMYKDMWLRKKYPYHK